MAATRLGRAVLSGQVGLIRMAIKRAHQPRGDSPKPGGEGVLVGAEECAIGNDVIGPTIEFAPRA